jgi:hypothetical protein
MQIPNDKVREIIRSLIALQLLLIARGSDDLAIPVQQQINYLHSKLRE